jgi:hypothetical protein
MSVTTQIIFPYMSDAHAPAMDIRMSPQDTAMALSFWQNLRSILIEADGYQGRWQPVLLVRYQDVPFQAPVSNVSVSCCGKISEVVEYSKCAAGLLA